MFNLYSIRRNTPAGLAEDDRFFQVEDAAPRLKLCRVPGTRAEELGPPAVHFAGLSAGERGLADPQRADGRQRRNTHRALVLHIDTRSRKGANVGSFDRLGPFEEVPPTCEEVGVQEGATNRDR